MQLVSQFESLSILKKLYSKPKIHISHCKKSDQKKPLVGKNNYWYVYYSYRNPTTGKMNRFTVKKGINYIYPVSERIFYIKALQKAVLKFLQNGFSPFDKSLNEVTEIKQEHYTVKNALEIAYNTSFESWKEST